MELKKKKTTKNFKIHKRNQNTCVRNIQRKFESYYGMATGSTESVKFANSHIFPNMGQKKHFVPAMFH